MVSVLSAAIWLYRQASCAPQKLVPTKAVALYDRLLNEIKKGHPRKALFLLDHGCPVDPPPNRSISALSYAVYLDRPDLVRTLIKRGASLSGGGTDRQGYITPLTAAFLIHGENRVLPMLRLLVRSGLSIRGEEPNCTTSSTLLLCLLTDGDLSLFKYLARHGADIFRTVDAGYSIRSYLWIECKQMSGHQKNQFDRLIRQLEQSALRHTE